MAAQKVAFAGVAAGVMSLVLTGCGGNDDTTTTTTTTTIATTTTTTTTMAPEQESTIAELAVATDDLSTLVTALSAADLVDIFNGTDEYTVFAPTNEGFAALDEKVFECLQAPVGIPTLAKVLEYHVVAGKALSTGLTDGEELKTLDGDEMLTVKLDGKSVMINKATVETPDVEASNGVVHIIDQVMIPSDFKAPNCGTGNIAETAEAVDDLSTLVTALSLADLVDTVSGTDVFTVFAPTNEAFAALKDVGTCLLKPENKAALTEVLKYHVVSGYVLSTDITEGLEADTVDTPEKLTFSTTGGVKINGKATVTAADNYCTNGVVHIINQVLVPANLKTTCLPASSTDILV